VAGGRSYRNYLYNHFILFSMLKKSDILPLFLALISTVLIVGLGFLWLTKINTARLARENAVSLTNPDNLDAEVELDSQSSVSSSETATESKEVFVVPAIVPAGTAVTINGSSKMNQMNQALRRGFHRQFPGTAITTNADGNKRGIDLLISGDIDLAAIDRPLNETEKAAGLEAMMVNSSTVGNNTNPPLDLYYAYQKPASEEVKAFLGYVSSSQGQQAINQR